MNKHGPVIKKVRRENMRNWELVLVKAHNNTELLLNLQQQKKEEEATSKPLKQVSSQRQNNLFFVVVVLTICKPRRTEWQKLVWPPCIYLLILFDWIFLKNEWKSDWVHYNEMCLLTVFMPSSLEKLCKLGKFIHSNNQREKYIR